MRLIKFQTTSRAIKLLIFTACVISCSSNQRLDLADIRSTCEKMPDFRDDPKGLKAVTFEGYLIAAEKARPGTSYDVSVGDGGDTVKVNLSAGTGNNQIQFTDQNNFIVRTDNGETLKPKDKVRITGDLGKTKTPEFYCAVAAVTKVEKP